VLARSYKHVPRNNELAYWDLPDESNRVLVDCRKVVAANNMRRASNRIMTELRPQTDNLGL
jgi:hypothetical protein